MDLAYFNKMSYSLLEVSGKTKLGNPLGSFKSQTSCFYNKPKPKNKGAFSLCTSLVHDGKSATLPHSVPCRV